MKKLIVFDLDDTLYPEKEYVISGLKYVAKFLSEQFSYPDLTKLFLEGFEADHSKVFNFAFERVGIPYDKNLILRLIDVYRNHVPNISLYKESLILLKHLYKIKDLCIITDGYLQAQKKKISVLKINKYFKKIYFTDFYGRNYWKPSTFVFKLCQKEMKVEPVNIIYIGDNWMKDFFPGNKLGWVTIGIKHSNRIHQNTKVKEEYKPKYEVNSIEEIIDYIY